MKQNEIELLMKDLCARLPYKVYAQIPDDEGYISAIESVDIDGFVTDFEGVQMEIEKVKPYLFPLSSMTEEQKNDIDLIASRSSAVLSDVVDFYNKNHIDYRGLIEKSLAIDATGLNIY